MSRRSVWAEGAEQRERDRKQAGSLNRRESHYPLDVYTLYQRLTKRMGSKKAIAALAHRLLTSIYHLLKEHQSYRELGPGHADEKAAEVAKRRVLGTLEQLVYDATLQPAQVA